MERFLTAQRVFIVKTCCESVECATQQFENSEPFLAEMKLHASGLHAD